MALLEIDEMLSPAQKRRKEVERLREEQAVKTFGPKAYVPYKETPEETLYGTTDPERVSALRAQGGVYSDPEVLKARMSDDPVTLGQELEAQLAELERPGRGRGGGSIGIHAPTRREREATAQTMPYEGGFEALHGAPVSRSGIAPEFGGIAPGEEGYLERGERGGGFGTIGVGGNREQRAKRETILALQRQLAATPPSENEQLRQIAKHESDYVDMAWDRGGPETIEQIYTDVANRKLGAKAGEVLADRIASRSRIEPERQQNLSDFDKARALPGSREIAEQHKNAQLTADNNARVAQAQQAQAKTAAAKPDQLADLTAKVTTPSGPEAIQEPNVRGPAWITQKPTGTGDTGQDILDFFGGGGGAALSASERGTGKPGIWGGLEDFSNFMVRRAPGAAVEIGAGLMSGELEARVAAGLGRVALRLGGKGVEGVKALLAKLPKITATTGEGMIEARRAAKVRKAAQNVRKATMQAAREAAMGPKQTPLAGLRAAEKGVERGIAETQKAGTTAAEAMQKLGAPRPKNIEELISEASDIVQTKLGRPLSKAETSKLRGAATKKEMAKILKALGL